MRSRTLLLLLCLLLLAFGLRVYRLDGQEIWGDEAYSITIASWPFSRTISRNVDTHPPLYYALLWWTIRWAGKSPFAVRFPSAMAGVLVVPLMYRLGRLICRETGILAAGLTGVSSFLIYYSQEARMYTLSLAGATGSLLTFWLAFHRQQQQERVPLWLWGAYTLSSLIAIYSHYYAFAVLLAEALFLVGAAWKDRHPSRMLPWLAVWGMMALCFLPWALEHQRFLGGKTSARFAEWNFAKFGEITARTLLAYGVGKTLPVAVQRWGWGVVGIALLGLGRMAAWGHRRIAIFLAMVLLVGLLFAWGMNPVMPFFEERYLLVCAPSFLLVNQVSAFQIKPVTFQVTEHLIYPHSATIGPQGLLPGGKTGCQQPGFFLALFPMGQQVRRMPVLASQLPLAQPAALTGLPNHIPETLPIAARKPNQMAGFLPQDILPSPGFQLLDDLYSAELAISHQQNRSAWGNQPPDIGQQRQLLDGRTVASGGLDPRPGDGNGSAAESQADDQQLMSKADFGPIGNEPDFPHRGGGLLQEGSGNGLKPLPHPNGRIVQKSGQAAVMLGTLAGLGIFRAILLR